MTLTAAIAGTGFTATSTANDVSGNGVAASTNETTTANVVEVTGSDKVIQSADSDQTLTDTSVTGEGTDTLLSLIHI